MADHRRPSAEGTCFRDICAPRTERRAAVDRRHRGRRLDPTADPTLAEHKRRAAAEYGDMAQAFLQAFPQTRTPRRNRPPPDHRHPGVQLGELDLGQDASRDRPRGRLFLSLQPRPAEADHRRPRRSSRTSACFTPLRFPTCSRRSMPDPGRAGRRPRAVRHDGRVLDELRRLGKPKWSGIAAWPRFDPQQPTTLHFSDGIHVGAVPDMATLEFWTAFDRQIRRDAAA